MKRLKIFVSWHKDVETTVNEELLKLGIDEKNIVSIFESLISESDTNVVIWYKEENKNVL